MPRIYDRSPNHLEKIIEVYAYVSCDKHGEGLIAESFWMHGKDMMMPFVCADKQRMEDLKPYAIRIAKDSGKKIKLIRLSVREDLEDIG